MQLLKKLDAWSLTHLLWPYALTFSLREWGVENIKAAAISILTVLIWEALDEINKRYNLKWWWLDPAGFCLTDLLLGVIGATVAFLLIFFF